MEEGSSVKHRPGTDTTLDFSFRELDGVAKYLDIDPDFWVFRRFGKLHLFNLLRLQLELVRLERQLESYMLPATSGNKPPKVSNKEKKKLFRAIHRALSEYGVSLCRLSLSLPF
jgi:hypothetical protein